MSYLDQDAATQAAIGCVLAGFDVLAPPHAAGPLVEAVTTRVGAGAVLLVGGELPAGAARPPRRADTTRWLRLRADAPVPVGVEHAIGIDGPELELALTRLAVKVPRLILAAPDRYDALAALLSDPIRAFVPAPARPRVVHVEAPPGDHPLRALITLLAAEDIEAAAVWVPSRSWFAEAASALDEAGYDVAIDGDVGALNHGEVDLLIVAGDSLPSGAVPLIVCVQPPPAAVAARVDALATGRGDGVAVFVLAEGSGDVTLATPELAEARRAARLLSAARAAGAEPGFAAAALAALASPDAAAIVATALRALVHADRCRRAEQLVADEADAAPGRRRRRRRRRADIE